MKALICSAAVAVLLAAAPALADAPKLPMGDGERAVTSALAPGEQYLSISKALKCDLGGCTAKLKGKAKKQLLITQVMCLTAADGARAAYGAMVPQSATSVALAVLPVISSTLNGTLEYAVVGGPTQVLIGPDDTVLIALQGAGTLTQVTCSLTGTSTKL